MAFEQTSQPQYSEFIHLSRYSRWIPEKKRRETWEETISRWLHFWEGELARQGKWSEQTQHDLEEAAQAIYSLEVMPSMRSMMTAGVALERDHVAGYNCAYGAVTGHGKELSILTDEMKDEGFDEPINLRLKNPTVFDEFLYILLCGTGQGFSSERQYVVDLPTIGKPLNRNIYRRNNKNYPGVPTDELSTINRKTNTIYVADSKYGWASAFRILIVECFNGNFEIKWDTSKVRPAGEPLKTFGGRSSGPGPLIDLFRFTVELFSAAAGRKLVSIEAHSLVCRIASIVVVGGVRRAALLGLSNLSDDRMRYAKSGDWWNVNPHFRLANNSVAYTERPSAELFLKEWEALVASKAGERGIFNRAAARKQAARNGRRDATYIFGVNPCGEIILRDQQFCNLSEVVAREGDSLEDLKRKVRIATFIGTLQSTLTDFKYLNPMWKKNTEEERLLGVSISGIMDHPILNNTAVGEERIGWGALEDVLGELKQEAIKTNEVYATLLGIPISAAITTVKPSGTVSQLVDSASGKHARHAYWYIRTARNDIKDPLSKAMFEMGFPYEVDERDLNQYVFPFPIKSPKNSVIRTEITALEQLEHWLIYKVHWCEHNPSCTISVGEDEWMEVGAWVYEHFDEISGLSFLPRDDHTYVQAPYQTCTEEEYLEMVERMPKDVDWSILQKYEDRDETIGMQEYACSAGSCELV